MNTGRRGIRSAFLAHSARASCRQGKSYKTREFCSLVTGDWIVENSNENVVILDCSNPVGFQRAHLPNAFNLPLAANGLKVEYIPLCYIEI
jgi:hypothetical protein